MPDSILDMRFNQNLDKSTDDEGFMSATYRAGIQVEKKKALKTVREAGRTTQPPKNDGKKDGQGKGNTDNARRGKETDKILQQDRSERSGEKTQNWWGGKDHWGTKDEALKGVPAKEQEEYGQSREDCWRCGRPGHWTFECFSFNTRKGTLLPPAPWKTAAVTDGKRKRSEEPEDQPAAKQQKIAAVETMDTNAVAPLWEDSESDF